MHYRYVLLFGGLAGVMFFSAMFALAPLVDGYSHVSQTVSEIGEIGSPAELYFKVSGLAVALALTAFAGALFVFAKARTMSIAPALVIACYAAAQFGLAIYPSPHALHNVFGLSMTIGYMAPLVLALSWRFMPGIDTLVAVSWIAFGLVVAAILLNLSPLVSRDLYPLEYYGLVQRSLFVAYYGWCFFVSVYLFEMKSLGRRG